MILKINGNTYESINWSINNNNEGVITLPANYNFNEFITEFMNAPELEIYNDEMQLISIWYTKEIMSMYKLDDQYIISISGNNIPQNTDTNLQQALSNAEDALIELAQMISSIDEVNKTQIEFVQQYRDQSAASINSADQKMNNIDARFNEMMTTIQQVESMIEPLRGQITTLATQISNVPNNIITHFSTLDNNYNTLMDRIATLENDYAGLQSIIEINRQLVTLEYNYNSLLDRVAYLENKLQNEEVD